jgi:hypothetical protein
MPRAYLGVAMTLSVSSVGAKVLCPTAHFVPPFVQFDTMGESEASHQYS